MKPAWTMTGAGRWGAGKGLGRFEEGPVAGTSGRTRLIDHQKFVGSIRLR
jgi:hypothetical protein